MKPVVPVQSDKIDNLSYILFPAKALGTFPQQKLYQYAYAYWRDFWREFYSSQESPEGFRTDEFYRQNMVAGLFQGDEVVAVHTYTFFDLRYTATQEHSYFSLYSELDLQRLKTLGLNQVMTMEFMAMNPAFRKSVVGISLAEVMVACGVHILRAAGLDASITIAREDYKVPEFARRVGFKTLRAGLSRHHCPCELMYLPLNDLVQNLSPEVQHYVQYFWDRRVDTSGLTTNAAIEKKRAA